MRAFQFSVALLLVAVALGLMLGWLTHLFLAVAAAVALVLIGEAAYYESIRMRRRLHPRA